MEDGSSRIMPVGAAQQTCGVPAGDPSLTSAEPITHRPRAARRGGVRSRFFRESRDFR